MRYSPCLAGLILTCGLWAQDAEIVVTATKEPTPSDVLPLPVVVLDADALAGKTSVSDALGGTVAVRLQALAPGEPALIAPGFGENGFGRIAFLFDGVPQDNPDMTAPVLDLVPVFALDRVEIVRGPVSGLYGSGALAGAVNVVTKTPRNWQGQIAAGVESGGTNLQTLAFGAPLAAGGLLLSVERTQNEPSRDRSDSGAYRGWTKLSLPFGEQTAEAWLAFIKSASQLPGALDEATFKDHPDQAEHPNDASTTWESQGGASWTWAHGDWKVSVPLSGRWRKIAYSSPSVLPFGVPYTGSVLVRASAEPRVAVESSLAGVQAQWSAGAGLSTDRLTASQYTDSAFETSSFSAQIDRTTISVWTRGQLGWDGRWFLSADIRAEKSDTSARSGDDAAVRGRKDFWPISGDVGLTWLSSGLRAAAQLSRVYRYPFIDEMVWYSGFGNQFITDIDAEVGHAGTVSLSYSTDLAQLTASGTLLRMDNEVAYTPNPAPFGSNANLGATWHSTALVSAEWTPSWQGAQAGAGAEYGAERATFATGTDEGKLIPLVPQHHGRFWLRAEHRAWGKLEAAWTLTSSYYQGGDSANALKPVPGRQSFDVEILAKLGSPDWTLRLYGHNLTDDRTPTYVSYGGWYPSEGRVLGASLAWTF